MNQVSDSRAQNLIGLCGFAQSGKDTAALGLIKAGFTRVAFADELKLELARAIRNDASATDESTLQWLAANKETLRPLMVGWGVMRRLQNPDYWINIGMARATCRTCAVITDVRYPNEAKALWNAGGFLVRITRPGVGPANSEEARTIQQIDDICSDKPVTTLVNDSSIEVLQGRLLDIAIIRSTR
jgi:hypothetical protein